MQKTTEALLRIELKQLQQTHTSGSTDSKTSTFDFTESALAMAAKNLEHSGFSSGGCKSLADPGKQLSSDDNNEPPVEVELTVRPPLDVKRHNLVLFVYRAKLYRFDTFSKQWKERGIGNIKILTYKNTGKFKILMRRYWVLKVCCNHLIVKGMTLTAQDEKSFQWVALSDLSDEEAKPTIFAVRFKLAETANTFKKIFDDCLTNLGNATGKNTSQLSTAMGSIPNFWGCQLCCIYNKDSVIIYIACCNEHKINITSSKSGMNSQQSIAIESVSQASEATKLCHSDLESICIAFCNIRSSKFNLPTQQLKSSPNCNMLSTVRIPAVKEKEAIYSSSSNTLSFAELALTANNENSFGGNGFGSDGNKDFDGTSTLSSGNDSLQSNAEFKPIVKVPSDIKLQSGEEDELVLFPYKVKHYQFDTFSQQWKIGRKGELVISKHVNIRPPS